MEHAYECWVGRPGGLCRQGCSCLCHAETEKSQKSVMNWMKALGIHPGDETDIPKFVALQSIMREWFKSVYLSGVFKISVEEVERMGNIHGGEEVWLDDWLDEATEEFLVG